MQALRVTVDSPLLIFNQSAIDLYLLTWVAKLLKYGCHRELKVDFTYLEYRVGCLLLHSLEFSKYFKNALICLTFIM